MKEKILKIFGSMKKLFLLVLLFPWMMLAQGTDIYGTWTSYDTNETLVIQEDNSFTRVGPFEAFNGYIEVFDGVIYVTRSDGEEYELKYFISNVSLYIEQPFTGQAWIFTKISY